jgi:inner membrane protein
MLAGACLSRTGLNRRAAYATLTMVIAAELPDVDTLWGLRGSVEGFQHHRGITHTFLGLPFEAAFIVAGVYGWHRWRLARQRRNHSPFGSAEVTPTLARVKGKALTSAPLRWGVLYGLALLALLSHLLLDYTNNYGLRPFFPFNDRWYAASIVFIFDPVIFVLLSGALAAPWIFGLVGSEVGARKSPFRARGWAIAALLGMAAWWGLREVEHDDAIHLAMSQSIVAPLPTSSGRPPGSADVSDAPLAAPVPVYLSPQRVLASPDPLSPFHWSAAMDFGPVYQMGEIDSRNRSIIMGDTTYPKPGRGAAVLAAEGSKLGRAYMDWSSMPVVEVSSPRTNDATAISGDPGAMALRVVTFRDLRFMGGWMRDNHRSALTGTVSLNSTGDVVRQTMDGRVER